MKTYLILLFVTTIVNSFLFCQDPEVLLAEANSKMKIGELKLADSLLNESLKIDPSFAPAVVAQSKLWLRKGEINKAIPLAENAVNLDGEFLTLEQQMSIKSCKYNLKIYEIDGKEPKRIGGEAKMKPLDTGYALSKQIIKEFIRW